MNVPTIPVCAALLLLSSTAAQGQACLGLASLETRPMNLTVGARFASGVKGGDARFGLGTSKAFGGVTVQVAKSDGISGTAKGVGVDGGLSYPVGAKKRAMLCPIADAQYAKLPDVDAGEGVSVSGSGTGVAAGLAIGGLINNSSSVGLIPFAALRAAYDRVKVSGGGFSESTSDTYGILSGGLSFVFSQSVLVRPIVSVPIGLEGSDPSYGVGVSFAFGKR